MIQLQRQVTVTDQAIRQFAEATGDWNPIHFDDQAARQVGLSARCAHGLWTAGLAGHLATSAGLTVSRLSARFKRAATVGMVVQITIEGAGSSFRWEATDQVGQRLASGELLVVASHPPGAAPDGDRSA